MTVLESTTTIRPFRIDPSTRTAWFIVPDAAVTGDVTVSATRAKRHQRPAELVDHPRQRGPGQAASALYTGDGLFLDLVGHGSDIRADRIEVALRPGSRRVRALLPPGGSCWAR